MQLSPTEILVVAVIALIVLGPERLPKAARQLGRALNEFKKFSAGVQSQVTDVINATEEAGRKTIEVDETGDADQSTSRSLDDQTAAGDQAGNANTQEVSANKPKPNVEGFRLIDGGASKHSGWKDSDGKSKQDHPSNGHE